MARFEFRLPDIGEGIAQAEIVAWRVKVGDRVEEDQNLADMMTDKATVEMESPVSGTVVALSGEVGDLAAIGSVLLVIETDAAEVEAETEEATPVAPLKAADAPQLALQAPNSANAAERAAPPPIIRASPAVRARAQALGVALDQVRHAGDYIRHADLDAYLRYRQDEGYHAPAAHTRADEVVKVVGLRRRIAENMAASKRHIPHFTYVDEINVTELERMRADLNAHRGARPKLTLLPFLIVAICKTLPDFPMLNARYDDEAGVVTRHGQVHLGLATQTDAGLMVPVIRNAQDRNIWQLADDVARLAEAARTGKARAEDLSGSTLTLSSLGPLGGIASAPVINRPEVAIIAPNRIVERPIFAAEDIVRAKLMNLSIACDHRVVDGHDAASFVAALRQLLETPVLLFAET